MHTYQTLFKKYQSIHHDLKKTSNVLSYLRVVTILGIIYLFYLFLRTENALYGYISFGMVVLFVILINRYQSVSKKLAYHKALMQINEDELNFLEKGTNSFDDGAEYTDSQHPYSYDLDIFGTSSIFQYINRTASYVGKDFLARILLHPSSEKVIVKRQEAVKELSGEIDWRQKINALTKISNDSKVDFEKLKQWCTQEPASFSKIKILLSYLVPVVFLFSAVAYLITSDLLVGKLTSFLFVLNLMLFSINSKRMQQEIVSSDKISHTLSNYGGILREIEQKNFSSVQLTALQRELIKDNQKASDAILRLSAHFEKLQTIANIFVMIVFNGFFQYHNHVLQQVIRWKKQHALQLIRWFEIAGEVEALNSLANCAYNNPNFTFPHINHNNEFKFTALGHPLIRAEKRVCNDIDFTQNRFVILTGSNMSGKSTFLRTVGVNLVLANAGATVCAEFATVAPMELWVSMRLTDSLNDSESFFYAEVKRLKTIVEHAAEKPVFILLDEILKGTNSDDKTSGTIGVIEKIICTQATGMIATHDLEVCKTTYKYPEILANKRFEVAIINDELCFDYKMQDGICENRNATFIMQKMGII